MLEAVVSFDQVQEARKLLRDLGTSHWITDDLFTWQWWLLLVASIVPWVILLKFFIDRERILEILTYGFVIQTIAVTLDVIGADLLLWAYPDKLLPFSHRCFQPI
ncbi:hypothetical protein ACFQI7_35975 [Paenibacillus allorhizosphaerae]|uniref:hypothetical protein n=1 Tax=Paenibacillus allorhizosphaerae TaxID=2849866 RepID=UPI001E2FBD1D|nr:hypothetical protein [Paenibacillus allorhizosphaerae]